MRVSARTLFGLAVPMDPLLRAATDLSATGNVALDVMRDVPRFAYTYVVPGVFAQDDINVASCLSLSASARVDFHNIYGTFFSPRLSALIPLAG